METWNLKTAAFIYSSWILFVWSIPSQAAECGTGWFGSECQYKCRCTNNNCNAIGLCTSDTKCQGGWFGPACQYADLAYNRESAITDGDDDTCMNASSIADVKLNQPRHVTWIRIHFRTSGYLHRVIIQSKEDPDFSCINQTYSAVDATTLDIQCDPHKPVQSLTLVVMTTEYICSVYISGGRNVALRQNTTQSSTYSEKSPRTKGKLITYPSENSVDGNTSGDFYGQNSCSHTEPRVIPFPTWNVRFSQAQHIRSYVIHNRIPDITSRLKSFTLESFDASNTSVFEYTDSLPRVQDVYTVEQVNVTSPVYLVTLTANNTEQILQVCEIEVYGESACEPGRYGRECEQTCNCAGGQPCFISTGGCPSGCAPGFYGESCDLTCSPGLYGATCGNICSEFCSKNDINERSCDHVNGTCLLGCESGYTGSTCNLPCKPGFYGPQCSNICSEFCFKKAFDEKPCDHVNGTCLNGCVSVYKGPTCSLRCSNEWFGSLCQYKCRCTNNNCDEDGVCTSGAKCQGGWFGPACQYADLAYNRASDTHITDGDDRTCTTSSLDTQRIKLDISYHFMWLRIHVRQLDYLHRLTIHFNAETNLSCNNLRNATVDDTTLDIYCDVPYLVQSVTLTGEGVQYLCSVYISGGRNLALKQTSTQSSTYSEQSLYTHWKNTSYPPENSIDSNTSGDFYGQNSCSSTRPGATTSPSWNLSFWQPQHVNRYVLYNKYDDVSHRLQGFTLHSFDVAGTIVFSYTDTLPGVQAVYTVPSANVSSPVSLVNIIGNNKDNVLHTCEVEVYGESACEPGKYGRECEQTCNCAGGQPCFISTGGCPSGCATGFYGESCDLFCGSEWFGSLCQYKCRCTNNNCDEEGVCTSGAVCQGGWFGPACQYEDLAYNRSLDANITDGDDNTCTSSSSDTLTVMLENWYLFTWMRVHVRRSDYLHSLAVHFNDNSSLSCINTRNATVDDTTLDIYCDLSETVQSVTLIGKGVQDLCSVYISGGRNVALKQNSMQSGTYFEQSERTQWEKRSYSSQNSVDGNTSGDLYRLNSCSITRPGGTLIPNWSVSFSRSRHVTRYVIYNRDDDKNERLQGFTLQSYEVTGKIVFSYTDTLPSVQAVYTVISGYMVTPISLVNITVINPEKILQICEVEVYGDSVCEPGRYGRECEHTCNCAGGQPCFISTGGCPSGCAAGFYGESCDLACGNGWFGSFCQYKCRCTNNNCDEDGDCTSGSVCQGGWFGPACQYADLAYNRLQDTWITDGDDRTCTDSNSGVITVVLDNSYPFTWLRVHVNRSDHLQSLTVHFNDDSNVSCVNPRNATVNSTTLDIHCDLSDLVQSVTLTGEGVQYLCSLYISGGRNVALRQRTSQSEIYLEQSKNTGETSQAVRSENSVVDGTTSGRLDEQHICTLIPRGGDISPWLSVSFSRPSRVNRYVLYNGHDNRFRLKGFNLQSLDVTGIPVFTYTNTHPDVLPVYTVISLNLTSPISRVHIRDSDNDELLQICEVEVYGDSNCEPGKYGRECEHTCNCAGGQPCFISTGGCPSGCAAGFYGESCHLYNSSSGKHFTHDSDNPRYLDKGLIIGAVLGADVSATVMVMVLVVAIYVMRRNKKHKKVEKVPDLDCEEDMISMHDISGHIYEDPVDIQYTANKDNLAYPDNTTIDAKKLAPGKALFSNTGVYYNSLPQQRSTIVFPEELDDFMSTRDEMFFINQFRTIIGIETATLTDRKTSENKNMKKHKNICENDQSRVHLTSSVDKKPGDCLYASYITGYTSDEIFIASQSPTKVIVEDFVRMLWEQEVEKVIMFNNVVEDGMQKCERYWPEDGEMTVGEITIKLTTTEVFADYTIRRLQLTKKDNTSQHLVHFHFTSWTDKDVPNTPWGLVCFEQKVASYPTSKPIVVHCSDGVSRTGIYIALRKIMRQAEKTGHMDIFTTVQQMRHNRFNMIQTADQYKFLHKAVQVAMLCIRTTVTSLVITNRISALESKTQSGETKMEAEFKSVCTACEEVEQERIYEDLYSQYETIQCGTRGQDKGTSCYLPKEMYRAKLRCDQSGKEEYSNAVLAPSFRKQNQQILTQLPLPTTVTDFWRLVTQYKVSLIVAFEVNLEDTDQTVADYLTSSDSDRNTSSKFTIKTKPVSTDKFWRQQTLVISMDAAIEDVSNTTSEQHVIHLTITTTDLEPDILLAITQKIRSLQPGDDERTLYMCRNGAAYCGLVYVLSLLLDRMDNDQCLTVPLVVGAVKSIRPQVIPTLDQYRLLYKVSKLYSESTRDNPNDDCHC